MSQQRTEQKLAKRKRKNVVSRCCHASVKVKGMGDFSNKDNVPQTLHYECSECGRACDGVEKNKQTKEKIRKMIKGYNSDKELRIGGDLVEKLTNEFSKLFKQDRQQLRGEIKRVYKETKSGLQRSKKIIK